MVVVKKLKKYLKIIEERNKYLNIFLQIKDKKDLLKEAEKVEEKIKNGSAGRLAGYFVGVKPNINVLGFKASCSSKTLEDYESTYDAEVIKRIRNEDGIIIGITNSDEFASGSSGETSAFGPCRNPIKPELIPGGSSSGSAAAVSAEMCDVALGSDTGGSIRNPSSHCGVVGLKPTYGSVSRYGLIDLSMSLDQIGPIGRNIHDVALLLDVIRGVDEKDPISIKSNKLNLNSLSRLDKHFKIGAIDFDALSIKGDKRIDSLVKKKLEEAVQKFKLDPPKELDNSLLDILKFSIQIYYPIVYTEFFSATRKFDGRKYGCKIEDSCGPEVLRRILGGAEITKAEHAGRNYYLALKAKKKIENIFQNIFKDIDVIVSPVVPRLPHEIGKEISVNEMYGYDIFTIPANLAGICSIVVPGGNIDGVPVGIQIMANKFNEQKMLEFAKLFEKI